MERDLRRLIIVAAALLVLLFTGKALISALYDADDAMNKARAMRGRLRNEASTRPPRAAMTAASTLREELSTELEALLPRIGYEQPDDFSVGSGDSPDLRYIEIVRREQELLVKGAAFVGRAVPSNLGMPDLNPTGLEDVLRTLRSLHIVHVVVSAALDAGVDAVDEIKVPPVSRRQRAEAGFLRTHAVEFDVRGSPQSVRDTLALIAGSETYLALDDVRLEGLDEEGGRVRCRFSAAAVTVDAEQTVLEAGSR